MRGERMVGGIVVVVAALSGAARCDRGSTGNPNLNPVQVVWEEPIEVATGPAHVGPWRMNDSEFHYVDDPTLAFGPEGSTHVIWVNNQSQDIYFRSYDGEGKPRGAPVNVSRSPEVFSWLPRLVVGDGGHVFVLWQEIIFSGGSHGGEIFFARSEDGGETFERPVNLSHTTAGAGKGRLTKDHWDNGSLDLVRTPRGTLIAAWTEYEGALRVARSTDEGKTFTEPLHVGGTTERPFRGPFLAAATDDVVYLVFTEGEQSRANVQLVVSRDGGERFESPSAAFPSDQHQDAPKLAVGSEGSLHLVYAQRAAGSTGSGQILYARRRAGANLFERPRVLSAEGASATFPDIALDSQDRVYVLWEHAQGEPRPRGLGWTVSLDGGESFAPPAVVPGTDDPALGANGNLQGKLTRKLAVGDETFAVVSGHLRLHEASRVFLRRGVLRGRGSFRE